MPAAATSQIKHITNAAPSLVSKSLLPIPLPSPLVHSSCSICSHPRRYYSDLSASRCASNLTNFAQIMRRPQMMTMTTTRAMALAIPVSVPLLVLFLVLVQCSTKGDEIIIALSGIIKFHRQPQRKRNETE